MILIVDDNQENIFSLQSLLQLHLFKVDTALSGEEALKKILKNSYSLIILDVQMPGMDGYEVAESITGFNRTKDIPIIFLSAVNTDKRFVTKGYISGGIDYVTKPFDPDILLLKVKNFIKLSEQNQELNRAHATIIEAAQNLEVRVEQRTRELQFINQQLESRNHDLQQFASVASHDLQEPLRKIHVFSCMVKERYLVDSEEARSYMDRIISSSSRMSNMINDLLTHSGLSATNNFESTDLNIILSEILADLELVMQEKKARIQVGVLPLIEAVPGQIRQVFQNVITNALKFSKKEEPNAIQISCERVAKMDLNAEPDPAGGYFKFVITDNGIGFDEVYLDKIFSIFQRLHSKEEYQGTGIGLAIVKKIVEKHKGYITARSSENNGATFVIFFPEKQL